MAACRAAWMVCMVAAAVSAGWFGGVARAQQPRATPAAESKPADLAITGLALPSHEPPLSFRHDVMPVFSKAGCNQGACHGYSLGKNGFKLSLRGGDERWDYHAITQEFLGRRINRQQPEASLLLRKPLGDLPHGGGVRMERADLLHRTLLDWIEQGAAGDLDNPLHLVSVAVHPRRVVCRPGAQQQLQVIAAYSDGTSRDVTPLAVFTSNAELLAEVDPAGLVRARDVGETAVVVRFERMFDVSSLLVAEEVVGFVASEVPQDNLVDQHVVSKLNELGVTPSGPASDAEFLRRVFIDLIGLQPTPDEVRTFMADSSPGKWAAVVDELFQRPRFVDYWALKWGDLLQNSRTRLSDESMWAFREWIRGAVASNLPLDEFARRLLTAKGSFRDDPASAYFLISQDENDTLQRATQVFLGVRMLCAKCHNHPFENWTQADYYGLAGFFNQVTAKQDPLLPANGKARVVTLDLGRGHAVNPRSGAAQPPRLLGGGEPLLAPGADRREAYAAWLTSPDNKLFARSLVNRFWSYFFHRGIIEPVDDLRNTNPPINPELLDALAADFAAHGYDARRLMRLIVTSRTYQRCGQANDSNARDELNFSRAVPRRLKAEVLLDCLVQATDVPENFADAPAGFTAAQLPDANVTSELLTLFGKPQRIEACECERDDSSNMQQALQFINGPAVLARLAQPAGRVERLVAEKPLDDQLIEELYLWSLARLPSDAERQVALAHFQAYGSQRQEAAQDLMWALLNSKNFLFNH
ncbi:MAG: DUF1549 domain-containing protein [Pirellulales bacterium]